MSLQTPLIILAAVANLALGATVLVRNPRGEVHRYFSLFSLAVASWTLSNGLVTTFAGTHTGYVWARLAFVSAASIPLAFLLFASVFPVPDPPPQKMIFRSLVWTGIAFALLSLTPLMVRGTTSVAGNLQVHYGPLHLPFGLYFVLCFGFSLFLLTKKLLYLKGAQQLQVRYLFFAVLTSAIGATLTNLVIPIALETSEFSKYGPLFGILMVAVIAHAIIRHRLLDIRVVIRQGAVYICAIAIAAACFFALAEVLHRVTGYDKDAIPMLEALVLAVLVAIFFQPLKSFVQKSLNTYLYRSTYDYQRTLREASRQLSTMLELEALLDYLTRAIDTTLKVDSVSVYLKDAPTNHFTERSTRRSTGAPLRDSVSTLKGTAALALLLQTTRTVFVSDDAVREPSKVVLIQARSELKALDGELAVPLLDDHALAGIVIVGPKRSGDAFFPDDLDLLSTLVSQAAITVKNAELYRQVVLVNEYVENILRTMDSGVITVDGQGKVALCNSTAERLTGLKRSDLLSRDVASLPPPLGLQLTTTLSDGDPRSQVETSLPAENGKRTPLVCSTSALRDIRGKILGALVVFSDLSKVKELENDKRRAERLASFGALVSGIAHEIKNPLVAIKTFAELLPERFSDTDFREDFSKVVGTEIDRIDGLVGRLRSLAAPVQETTGPIDIREPIQDTLALLRAQFEQTRTTVHRNLGTSRLLVAVDPSQIKQLFLNLLLNAIEAMGQGGEIRIVGERRENQGPPSVHIEISDTGPGVPEVIRGKLFEPFFTTKARGSGLGLAICRSITDAHRGTIQIQSNRQGQGTCVVVEFPATSQTHEPEQQPVLTA